MPKWLRCVRCESHLTGFTLLGVVVVVVTETFGLEASVGIVEPLHPPESASWQLMRSASGRSKSSKTTASHMQKVTLLPKFSDRLRTCRKSCTPDGTQEKRTTSLKSPSGPKGCPNGCGQSRCRQVSLYRHQLLKILRQPQTMVSFVSVRMHCELWRVQPISRWLRRSLRWLMNAVPPSRKKCPWLVGPTAGHQDREKGTFGGVTGGNAKRFVTIHSASSNFALEHKQTGARRHWPSCKQSVPKLLRRVRPQRSRTISRSCCAEPCTRPM